MKGETKKPLLIFVRGLPGAGKSNLTELLCENPILKDSWRLDPDRVNLTGSRFLEFVSDLPTGLPSQKQIYRYLLRQAEAALREGCGVIWEQPWRLRWGIYITIENLTYFLTGGTEISLAPFQTIIIEVLVDVAKARRRVAERFAQGAHNLDAKTFEEFVETMELCDDLGLPFIRIDGNDVAKEVHAVENLIAQLLGKGERDVCLSG